VESAGRRKFDIILCMANDNEAETALMWLVGIERDLLKENKTLDTEELVRGFLNYWVVMMGFRRDGQTFPGAVEAVKLTERKMLQPTDIVLHNAGAFASTFGTLDDGSKPKFSSNVLIYVYGYMIALSLGDQYLTSPKVVDGKINISYPDGTSFTVSVEDMKKPTMPGAHPLFVTCTMHIVKVLMRRLALYRESYPESQVFKGTPLGFMTNFD
jgi:hypothetical protein